MTGLFVSSTVATSTVTVQKIMDIDSFGEERMEVFKAQEAKQGYPPFRIYYYLPVKPYQRAGGIIYADAGCTTALYAKILMEAELP